MISHVVSYINYDTIIKVLTLYISIFPPLIAWYIYQLNKKKNLIESLIKLNNLVLETDSKIRQIKIDLCKPLSTEEKNYLQSKSYILLDYIVNYLVLLITNKIIEEKYLINNYGLRKLFIEDNKLTIKNFYKDNLQIQKIFKKLNIEINF